jgi:putative SOS response-associated peptidase YedK
MPGRLVLERPLDEGAASLNAVTNLEQEPRRNMAPGEDIAVLDQNGLSFMRWGLIPVGRKNARGRPVMETIINARSETVFDKSAFQGVGRAVVPVDGWYEWTGEKRRKTAWRIRPKDGQPLLFAAITDVWNGPGGIRVPQVATVTCDPNADVRDIHHRMGVILDPDDVQSWLADEKSAPDLMRPWPDGRLLVEPADDVDWSAR